MKLLAAIDFSDATAAVVDVVRKLASACPASVWLLHVAVGEPEIAGYYVDERTIRDSIAEKLHDEHRRLQRHGEALRAEGIECVALLAKGPAVNRILAEAHKQGADMIVVGSHGKGAVRRLLVGSTSEGVLHRSSVPVLIVPSGGDA